MKDLPGTIDIQVKPGDSQTSIKRIEAWETERILVIRCGLSGQDKTELKQIIEEANTLVGRIRQA